MSNLSFKNIILAKSNYLEWKSLVFQISHLMCVCVYIYIYEQKYLKNKSVYRVKYSFLNMSNHLIVYKACLNSNCCSKLT